MRSQESVAVIVVFGLAGPAAKRPVPIVVESSSGTGCMGFETRLEASGLMRVSER